MHLTCDIRAKEFNGGAGDGRGCVEAARMWDGLAARQRRRDDGSATMAARQWRRDDGGAITEASGIFLLFFFH